MPEPDPPFGATETLDGIDMMVIGSAPLERVFDPEAFRAALDEDGDDGGYMGPPDERPPATPRIRTSEDEVWARLMRRVVADPRQGYRRLLIGDEDMASRLRAATASMPHFAAVVGIIERAVVASARLGMPLRFPPILMLSAPGLGKTFFARAVATALGTLAVPIALNQTSDRGQVGGQSPAWRGARLGKLAKAILFDCETAAPLFLLDEIDKCSNIAGEDVASVLLSALEAENAAHFVDEYADVPIRLDRALWLTSANTTETISPPLLSRLLVIEVPLPSQSQARAIIRSIARATVGCPLDEQAVDLLTGMSARQARQAIELAHPVMVCAGRSTMSIDDMRLALELIHGGRRRRGIGFTR